MFDAKSLATALGFSTKTLKKIEASLGSFDAIGGASEPELIALGAPPVLAKRLAAAMALGRAHVSRASESKTTACSAIDVANLLNPRIAGLQQEVFFTVALDVRNGILGAFEVARGTVAGVEVHPREVFRPAIRVAAAGIVIAHNHPTGDPTPSAEDIQLTRRLKEAGALMGIPVIDHVVLGGGMAFRSIAEMGGC